LPVCAGISASDDELEPHIAQVAPLHDRIAARAHIATYLKSARRLAFSEQGIFRHYPELDAAK
jgi:glutathione S-transferase